MSLLSQLSMSGGEVGPAFYPRTDLEKYQKGLKLCRNAYVAKHGGVYNRPGTVFVAQCGDSDSSVRLVPFRTVDGRKYLLEFGDLYWRVFADGAQALVEENNITDALNDSPCTIEVVGHGYEPEDEVYITGVGGMTELNGRNFKVTDVTADTFGLTDLNGNDIDATNFGVYTTGGTVSKVFQAHGDWELGTAKTISGATKASQAVITATSHGFSDTDEIYINECGGMVEINDRFFIVSDSTTHTFKIKDYVTGAYVNSTNYTTYTSGGKAYPADFDSSNSFDADDLAMAQFFASGYYMFLLHPDYEPRLILADSADPDAWSDGEGIVNSDDGQYFILSPVTAEASGGSAGSAYFWTVTSVSSAGVESVVNLTDSTESRSAAPTSGTPITLSWTTSESGSDYNIIDYNIYVRTNANRPWMYLTSTGGALSFIDNGSYTPDPKIRPPVDRSTIFDDEDFYPGVITGYQNRIVVGGSTDLPSIVDVTRSGTILNYHISSHEIKADDPIRFSLLGVRPKYFLDIGKLVIFAEGGEWVIQGGESGILTPDAINPGQYSDWGIADVPPIRIGDTAIFVQEPGNILRDLTRAFESSGYRGNDLTYYAYHLFEGKTVTAMAFQKNPHSIVWCVMDDGSVLSLTYIRETNIFSWARHDFSGGLAEDVAVLPGTSQDDVYFVIQREIDGNDVRYIERLDTRVISDIKDAVFMDSALTYDGRNESSSHTMTLSGGSDWADDETLTLTSSTAYFASDDVGNSVQLYSTDEEGNSEYIRLTITAYTSATVVSVQSNRTVPVELRGEATAEWALAADQITNLWHLEGEAVSVIGDGFVVASPNNSDYDLITVTDGTIQLPDTYGVVHIGLPITADVKTLDVDTFQGESFVNKNKMISHLYLHVEKTRGLWAGADLPESDEDPLEGLSELRPRENEDYDEPPELHTGVINITLRSEWTSTGSVAIRQVDPLPFAILAIKPEGVYPLSRD